MRGRPGLQHGYSVIELLIAVALLAVVTVIAMPGLKTAYARFQVDSSVALIASTVQHARMSALKEKRSYRVLVHDESAATPNTVELQRDTAGSFVTVPGQVHTLPGSARILDTSPSNVSVSTRGECTSGTFYVANQGANTGVLKVATTCLTSH
jgi:prepilin-type N-terminal cleavage/methylation domain-containing protein